MRFRIPAVAVGLAVGLAVPGVASAADFRTAVEKVKTRTDKADGGLDRAAALFRSGRDGAAARAFAESRKNMRAASRGAARLRSEADTGAERSAAARALAAVAQEQAENVDELARLLRPADGGVERQIAAAALADTRGRDKAIAILTVLAGEVPDQAQAGIARAIAALSQGRDDEVLLEAKALVSSKNSGSSKRTVTKALVADVRGQPRAAARLAELIADGDMPAESKPGLQRAYDAVVAEHGSIADILSRFSDRMPASVRTFVEQVVTQVREDAQSMRDDRPQPPTDGKPDGTPSGPPQP